MDKSTGFLVYKRKEPEYRPVDERIKDYKEVKLLPNEEETKIQAARCMDCGIPFCHEHGCPVVNIIPEFNELVFQGEWELALDILLSTNNFPEFTGRICPAPCETSCVSGINDDPVAIKSIELAIIEKGFKEGFIRPVPPEKRIDKKVAVIGSGPAGLAAADTLNKAGYYVTVYEKAKHPGGLLRYGVPDFKLEKNIVERRIDLMKDEGVKFETEINAGVDISFHYLEKNFDAVCLACGSEKPRDLNVEGRDFTGIFFAMDYLYQQNRRNNGESIDSSEAITAAGKSVVIVGGGDTGSDCLGTAIRQGAKEIHQLEIMPKPPKERSENTPWPQWPLALRESHAHKEGGKRHWSVLIKSFIGENRVVKKLKCADLEWTVKDKRSVPVEMEGTEFTLDADLVILAMGFTGPEKNKIIEEAGIELDNQGNVRSDINNMTSVEGFFTAGDMKNGQSLVVSAISDGRKAAEGIINYLSDR